MTSLGGRTRERTCESTCMRAGVGRPVAGGQGDVSRGIRAGRCRRCGAAIRLPIAQAVRERRAGRSWEQIAASLALCQGCVRSALRAMGRAAHPGAESAGLLEGVS